MARSAGVETGRATQTAPSWGRPLVGIEGLRGIAALTVVLGHVRIHTVGDVDLGVGGRVLSAADGLTLFFALSGFLLFRPFATSIITGRPRPDTGRFFRNRALRIFPAYVVIFLLSSYVLQTTYTRAASGDAGFQGARETLGPITEWWHVVLNLGMVQTLVPGSLKTGLGVAWSLTAELFFYLVLPLLAWGAAALASRTGKSSLAVWSVPVVLFLTGVVGRLVSAATLTGTTGAEIYDQEWGATWHAVFERSIIPRADLFGYGAAAAVVFVLVERGLLAGRAVTLVKTVAFGGALLTAFFLLGPGLPSVLGMRMWDTAPVGMACAALILWAALPTRRGGPSLVGRTFELRGLRYAGLTSYSLYLWHLPVLWWLAERGLLLQPSPWGYVANAAMVVTATMLLSSVTYHFVEVPALRLKKRTDGGQAAQAGPPDVATTVTSPTKPGAVLPTTSEPEPRWTRTGSARR